MAPQAPRHAVQKNKDFSNGLKNPTEKILSVGFFNPLEIFFLVVARPRWADPSRR
jgi:hypothetical protein